MMKDIKLGFKLLKYSYSFKMNIALTIFFQVIGILMMLVEVDSFIFGGVYCYLGAIIIMQMSYSLLFAQMIPASPKRKALETSFANFINCAGGVLWYLILTALVRIFSYVRPALQGEYNAALVEISIFMVIGMCYYGICYKYFVVGTITFVVTFFTVYSLGRDGLMILLMKTVGTNLPATFAVGLVIILVGCVVSSLLRKLLYKKSVSPLAMGANLRKAMS